MLRHVVNYSYISKKQRRFIIGGLPCACARLQNRQTIIDVNSDNIVHKLSYTYMYHIYYIFYKLHILYVLYIIYYISYYVRYILYIC